MGAVGEPAISVVALTDVDAIPLPNGSWSRMVLTVETVPGICSSLGFSVFTPGTVTGMVSHDTEEVAYVLSGIGELQTELGLTNPGCAHHDGQSSRNQPAAQHLIELGDTGGETL